MSSKPVDTAIVMVVGPCIDDTDFKSLEEAIAYNAAGMDVSLIVEKTDGTSAVTAITLTTAGTSDWTHKDGGYYEVEITAAQNAEEGIAYLRGVCTGVLPFESPRYDVVKANIYDSLIKGTDKLETDMTQCGGSAVAAGAIPNAAADAAGGLPVSDAGGLDLDTKLANTNEITAARMGALTDWINGGRLDNLLDAIPTTAMRGTDNAALATTALTNVTWTDAKAGALADWINGGRLDLIIDLILADTAELQGNQAAWATATGFSTHSAADIWSVATRALTDKSGFALSATGANLILKDSTFALAMADAMWDEILSGATHNIAGSAGRRVRETGAYAIESGTAQAGNSHTITLAATASAVDGTYNRNLIVITDNTGVGQARTIVDYNGTTKVAIIDRDWRTSPDVTTEYQVTPNNTPLVVDQGVAQAGTATTITLRAYASAVNDTYLCNVVAIIAGTGRGQARLVGAYNGTTKVVTICGDDWITNPDTTSVYVLMPYGTTCTSCIGTHALGLINAEVKDCLTIDTIADSYATDGAQPTIAQGILAIQQMLQEKSISGTTLTVKKPDGSTVAMTFTLDSATAPTSITRAT